MSSMESKKISSRTSFLVSLPVMFLHLCSCAPEKSAAPVHQQDLSCAPSTLSIEGGSTGSALVFTPDPMASSGDPTLSPTSPHLDQFRKNVSLSRLLGNGILKGKYIAVGNGLQCGGSYGAYEKKNYFAYEHNDNRFQESMVYYYGDLYQENIDHSGYLAFNKPIHIIAHCKLEDNAFFIRSRINENDYVEKICLGDSVSTPGAYYSDDALVTLHELQHGATGDNYSMHQDLNQLWYDEAGALNEAISDFMSLMFTESYQTPSLLIDPKIFSRWALGTFDPEMSHVRGAHKCPMYDSHFPECDQFPKFQIAHPSNGNLSAISYVYPDGLGWPYPNNFKGANPAVNAFTTFSAQEEIHNTGMIILGALWDAYSVIKDNHPNDIAAVKRAMTQLVLESVRHLPGPSMRTIRSPVSYIGFAKELVIYSDLISGFTTQDRLALKDALKTRGLYDYATLDDPEWLQIGAGVNDRIRESATPGVYIQDDPAILKKWLLRMGGKPSIITQTASPSQINAKLTPGKIAALWFDIENQSDVTAGGVVVTATSKDPDLIFLDDATNIGYLPLSSHNQAQVIYSKINGKKIVNALKPEGREGIPTSNTYFKTNPFFNRNWRTALWVQVSSEAEHGKVVQIQVTATPSNGVTAVKNFTVAIH